MRRPRFALSIMLGAMAASISALGFPPVSNSPVANGGAPNAALICPVSSLAAESHPFHWFERSEAGPPEVAVDNWLLTIRAPADSPDNAADSTATAADQLPVIDASVDDVATNDDAAEVDANYCDGACHWACQSAANESPAEVAVADEPQQCMAPAMSLDACDLSIGECEEEYETARNVALELSGLAWIEETGFCDDFRFDAPVPVAVQTHDASELAADYRHSTGLADVLRINIQQGRQPRVAAPNPPAIVEAPAPSADGSFEHSLANDVVLTTIVSSGDAYAKFYRMQQSADEVAAWMRAFARNVTSGLSEMLELAANSAIVPAAEAPAAAVELTEEVPVATPVHTVSIVRPSQIELPEDGFELVSDEASRFVYVRSTPAIAEHFSGAAAATEPSVTNSFELVIDGPDRFLFLRKQGFNAPQQEPARSVAVLLPRPLPPAAAIGLDADWLAWDYFRFQVDKALELSNCNTTSEKSSSHDSLACDDFNDSEAWDCLAYARQDDSVREQIRAEEAASTGRDDAIQALIRQQAVAEGDTSISTSSLDEIAPISAPLGCQGADPIGCLTHRSQLRAERFAQSAAWSISKLAALLESCADELRHAAALQATGPRPGSTDRTSSGGDLEPVEQRTASQRFLSELYLGL